ncbi:hypothetical protein RKD37_005833 [Streptomyces ambofaciens]
MEKNCSYQRVAVALGRGLDAVEDVLGQAVRVVVPSDEEGLQGGQEGELRDPLVAVSSGVAGEFAGAHREPDEDDIAQVQGLQQGIQVGGEGVVVVAGADLRRAAEAAAVVGDDAVAGGEQLARLALPAVAVERVAVDEDDGLTRALVLVVELDRRAVLVPDGYVSHDLSCPRVVSWRGLCVSRRRRSASDSPPHRRAAPGGPGRGRRPARAAAVTGGLLVGGEEHLGADHGGRSLPGRSAVGSQNRGEGAWSASVEIP